MEEDDINKQKLTQKEQLILNIKQLIEVEKDLKKINEIVKQKKQEKKKLTEDLITTMKKSSIDCFDINGGSLVYKKKKTKKTVSGKFLLAQLEEIFKDQPDIAKDVTDRVMSNRTEVIKEEIQIKFNN